jgi:hypothetical protein
MWVVLFLILVPAVASSAAQSVWEIPQKNRDIQVDGLLQDWAGLPELLLEPAASTLQTNGNFGQNDLSVSVRSLWDQQNLYMALEWEDNIWDIREIRRREAIWISPEKKRRDRMYLFDNLKLHIEKVDYDYIFWISPRVSGQGPFMWHRLLQGPGGMERAVSAPMVNTRFLDNKMSMEMLFTWEELEIKPKQKKVIPLTLVVADSDLPDQVLETKFKNLKWLLWKGEMRLADNR